MSQLFCFECVLFFDRYLGAEVEMFSAEMLKQRFPWLNIDGIEAGSLGKANFLWISSNICKAPRSNDDLAKLA